MTKNQTRTLLYFIFGYIFCIFLWGGNLVLPRINGIELILPYNGVLLLFPYPLVSVIWLIMSLAMPLFMAVLVLKLKKQTVINSQSSSIISILSPLLLLPPSSVLVYFFLILNQQVIANTLFFVPVIVFTIIIFKFLELLKLNNSDRKISASLVVIVGISFFLFYWIFGWYFTLSCGEHSGDEGHYIIQAESLYQDHDLELSNNLSPKAQKMLETRGTYYIHIASTAKDGKFYSWHPFGVSAYLALLPPSNLILRHLLLGIMAGLGSAGMLLSCRYFDIPRRPALLFVALFSFSTFWGIYSSRALPEMPGAVLVIWIGVALLSVKNRPWISSIILIICCGYLPFLHPRFAPLSILGYLFFIYHFLHSKQLTKKLPVLLFTTISLACLAGIYFYIQSSLFTTASSYPDSSGILFAYTPGIWKVLTTNRSITYILPSFVWMFSAALLLLFTIKEHRQYVLFTFMAFFALLLVSCSYPGWTGGSSTIGRYLLAVCPLFIPLGAYVFKRTNRIAQIWFIFLAIIPVFHYILMLVRLPEFHSSFGDPRLFIGKVYDCLAGLLDPYPEAYASPPLLHPDGYLFPLVFFIATFLMLLHKKKQFYLFLYPTLIAAVAIYCHHPDKSFTWNNLDNKDRNKLLQNKNAANLMKYKFDQSYMISCSPEKKFNFFHGFNKLSYFQDKNLAPVTTDSSIKGKIENLIYQPDMPSNDWNERPYFWTTLGQRFQGTHEKSAFTLSGKLKGKVEAHLIVIEMGGEMKHTLLEKTFSSVENNGEINLTQVLHPTGDGLVHILIRLSGGKGTFIGKTIGWSPVSSKLLKETKAFLAKP